MMTIPKEKYENMVNNKAMGVYDNFIIEIVACDSLRDKVFKIEGTNEKVKMKCTQYRGFFTGTHCFVLK